VAEWFKAAVLKTANPQGFVGSNPTPSAIPLSESLRDHPRKPAVSPRKSAISGHTSLRSNPLASGGRRGELANAEESRRVDGSEGEQGRTGAIHGWQRAAVVRPRHWRAVLDFPLHDGRQNPRNGVGPCGGRTRRRSPFRSSPEGRGSAPAGQVGDRSPCPARCRTGCREGCAQQAAVRRTTFREAAERFIAGNKAGWRNAKHRAQWGSTLATYAYPHMGGLPVADVATEHVLAALHPIWTTKAETAARLRGRIEAVLDYARAIGLRNGDNPARWRGHLSNTLPARSQVAPVEHHAALPWRDVGRSWRRCKAGPARVPAPWRLPS
jgi:hypothetical protein